MYCDTHVFPSEPVHCHAYLCIVEETTDHNCRFKINATGNPRNISQSLSQYYGLFLITPLKVDHWLEFSMNSLENASDVNSALVRLNKSLAPVTFLVGPSVTLADFAVWAALKGLQIAVRCVQNCKKSVAGGFQ